MRSAICFNTLLAARFSFRMGEQRRPASLVSARAPTYHNPSYAVLKHTRPNYEIPMASQGPDGLK
jgi:hypothetical protein